MCRPFLSQANIFYIPYCRLIIFGILILAMVSFKKIYKNTSAATAIEYAMIAALLSIVALSTAKLVGSGTNQRYEKVAEAVQSAQEGAQKGGDPTRR